MVIIHERNYHLVSWASTLKVSKRLIFKFSQLKILQDPSHFFILNAKFATKLLN